jgi:hypothetical protein
MGADWIRRTESRFRHQIQEQALDRLRSSALFMPEEKMSITYPCHWLDETVTFPLGTHLIIFQRTPNSRVAVMLEAVAVAEVRGEAAEDLQRLFSDSPKLGRMLEVKIVRLGKPSEPFYVQAVAGRKKRTSHS